MSERKLKAWQQAGLIDASLADRIRAWEAKNSRPIGIWALVSLGALAIGLGVVSVVAANWDAIPGEVRLALHFLAMAGLAAFLWTRLAAEQGLSDWFADSLIFVAAILGLTCLAHIGQVYQTSSPLWQPLLAWLVIYSPLLLLFGRGWPAAGLWMAAVLGTAFAHADDYSNFWSMVPRRSEHFATVYWGLIFCPPMLVAGISAIMRERSSRAQFWRLLEKMAIVVILGGVSVAIVTRSWSGDDFMIGSVVIQSLVLLGAAGVSLYARPNRSGRSTAIILAAAAAIHIGGTLLAYSVRYGETQWLNAFCFLLLWTAVAYAALTAGWRHMFQCAIAVLAVRIIILSFELSDDLLGSGVGLIFAGISAMAVGWATVKVSKRYAPKSGEIA